MNEADALLAALDLYGLGPAVLQKAGSVLDRLLLIDVIRGIRHVGDDERTAYSTAHSAHVMQHLIDRDRQGVLIAEHDHGERVAHQDHVDSSLIDQPRSNVIVSGKTRNRRALLLLFLYGIDGDLGVVTKTRRGDAHCFLQCTSTDG